MKKSDIGRNDNDGGHRNPLSLYVGGKRTEKEKFSVKVAAGFAFLGNLLYDRGRTDQEDGI